MKKLKIFSRLIAVAVVFSLLCSASLISVYAASGTKYEVESNNTIQTANRTLDDYDNYGKIDQFNDNDYWFITFASEGMANFWLGDIPSGCDYDMFIYEKLNGSDSAELIATSQNSSNSQEFLRVHVKNFGTATYYVRIFSPLYHYNSSYYKMRIKNSAGISAQYFSYTNAYWPSMFQHPLYTEFGISFPIVNTNALSTGIRSKLTSMGYDAGYLNWVDKSGAFIRNYMALSDIVVINTHGAPGLVATPSEYGPSCLYATSPYYEINNDGSLGSFVSGSLNEVSLVIFAACETGVSDTYRGNLVDMALSKGAYNAIGWMYTIGAYPAMIWMEAFFDAVAEGVSIEVAIECAEDEIVSIYGEENSILDYYAGNENYLASTYLY